MKGTKKSKSNKLRFNDRWDKAIVSREVKFSIAQLLVISTLETNAQSILAILEGCEVTDQGTVIIPSDTVMQIDKTLRNASTFSSKLTDGIETLGDAMEALFEEEEEEDAIEEHTMKEVVPHHSM